MGFHAVDHRQQNGHADDPPQARQDTDAETQQNPSEKHQEVRGGQQTDQGLEKDFHVASLLKGLPDSGPVPLLLLPTPAM